MLDDKKNNVTGWFESTKHKAIAASVAAFLLGVGVYMGRGYFVNLDGGAAQATEFRPLVEVKKLKLTNIRKRLRFVGNIKPNEQVILKSEVDAVIKSIHFFEGQNVQSGDLLISFDDADAKARVNEIEAKYLNADAELTRAKGLVKGKYISESELSKKDTEKKAFFAQLEQAENYLHKHKVYAPFSGRVGLKEISIGEFINRGRDMLTLVDETPMKVDFKVPEMMIHKVRVGQYVTVNVDGVMDDFTAVIRAIDPVGDKTSHSFVVRAILDEDVDSETYGIYPGQFARVSLINDGEQKAIMISEGSLVRSGESESVYRILDGAAILTEVIVGENYDGEVEILGGLSEGDLVVINGQERIRDGIKVRMNYADSADDPNLQKPVVAESNINTVGEPEADGETSSREESKDHSALETEDGSDVEKTDDNTKTDVKSDETKVEEPKMDGVKSDETASGAAKADDDSRGNATDAGDASKGDVQKG